MKSIAITMCILTLVSCGSDTDDSIPGCGPDDEAIAQGPGATSVLNAGVMTRLGDEAAPVKFLFDPLYDDHYGTFEPLDNALIDRIVNGTPPYDGVAAVFVSHAHGDHFSPTIFNRLMKVQGDIRLVAPVQAVDQMRAEESWDPVFATRITAISLANGEQAEPVEIAGVTVEAFRSPHSGWPTRHRDVHNLTYRVSAASGAGTYHRVMHFGDADPARRHYESHGEFLSAARTGLAIVPYWHFGTSNPDRLFDETFNAEAAVGMHVPVAPPEWLRATDRPYFTGEGQQADIPETR